MTQAPNDALPIPNKGFSFAIVRLVGYGLLILSLLEYATLLIPPQLMNPEWEFSTLGQMVERVPVPLLALALIFLGDTQGRQPWERPSLKALSWLALGFSLFLVLLTPFWGVMNTMRLNTLNETAIAQQYEARAQQLSQFEQQLNQASPEDITNFLATQGVTLDNTSQPPKAQILNQLQTLQLQLQEQVQAERSSRRNTLMESSIKWNLSALVSSALFAYIWHLTLWARVGQKKRSPKSKKPTSNPEALS